MRNTPYCGFGILTRGALNFNNSLNFSKISKILNGIEKKLFKLHFLSLNEIPKVIIFKVTVRTDQGTSTFLMSGP